MKRLIAFFALATAASAESFVLKPGQSAGPVTRASTEASLKEMLGANQVSWDPQFNFADQPPIGATVLYPKDPARTLRVVWRDRKNRTRPEMVVLTGFHSRWKTTSGLSVGSTVEQLESWNGRPFKLSGFDWDYGGLPNFERGRLDGMKNVSLTLGRDPKAHLGPLEETAIEGEKTLDSNMPAVRKAHVRVEMLIMNL